MPSLYSHNGTAQEALAGAYLFGGINAIQLRMQAMGTTMSAHILAMLPYIFTIVVLVIATMRLEKGSSPEPESLGLPYDREDRKLRQAQLTLVELIKKFGEVNGEIVKVDRLLNHMVDIDLIKEIGEDIAEKFSEVEVDKILTVEASGIPARSGGGILHAQGTISLPKRKTL